MTNNIFGKTNTMFMRLTKSKKKDFLNLTAKTATGVALVVLLAGSWALITGPVAAVGDMGKVAAEHANIGEFAGYAGLHLLMLIILPLIFGAIGICVLAAFSAFVNMLNRPLMLTHEPVQRITQEQSEYVHWVE